MTAREALKRLNSLPTFSSGSAAIDVLVDGGFRASRVFEFFGRSNTGKTQLAMQAALSTASRGERALFLDSEGTFRPERIERMARARGLGLPGLLERIGYLRVRTTAEQSDAVRGLGRSSIAASAKLVVIDTLTKNFSLDYPGNANMVRRQGALDVHLSEISRDAFLRGRAYVLTNRVTFAQSGEDTRIGGRTVEQLVHASIRLEKEGEEVRGVRTDDGRSALFGAIGDGGFDASPKA